MRTGILLAGAALVTLAGLPGTAVAAPGFVSHSVNLRAGPGSQYPVVTRIPAGVGLNINGCVSGWGWCDVSTGNLRGWVSGRYLTADYNNRREGIIQIGPDIGLPFLVFNQDNYWGTYYRSQPFYRNYHPHNAGRPAAAPARHAVHANSSPKAPKPVPPGRGPDRQDAKPPSPPPDHGPADHAAKPPPPDHGPAAQDARPPPPDHGPDQQDAHPDNQDSSKGPGDPKQDDNDHGNR